MTTQELDVGALLRGGKIRCNLGIGEIIGGVIVWFVLMIVTLGIAAFFFPYSYMKTIINRCEIVSRKGEVLATLRCDVNFSSMVGHVFIWMLITIVTLGFGYLLYVYKIVSYCLNNTKVSMD